MDLLLSILIFVAGTALVIYVLLSAIRTFVLPRAASELLTRLLFIMVRFFFDLRAKKVSSYEARDHIMALYAPISLILLSVLKVAGATRVTPGSRPFNRAGLK